MKKLFLLVSLCLAFGFGAAAQNTVVVDSEKIFSALPTYADAMNTLDKLAEQYQTRIDNDYAEIEGMFNDYQNQRAYLSETSRASRENAIIEREREIIAYQERIFGQDGELMKRRIELIKPIQDRVFNTISNFAKTNNYSVVIDIASNPTVLYYTAEADKTEEIITLLK